MKKTTQKIKNIKNIVKGTLCPTASYRRRTMAITDYVTGDSFPVIVYILKGGDKSTLPVLKISMPARHKVIDGVGYTEYVSLLKSRDDVWTKSTEVDFDGSAVAVMGVQGFIEESPLVSLDIITIAQVEDMVSPAPVMWTAKVSS